MDISQLRKEYSHKKFSEEDLNPSPFKQFSLWLQEAIDAQVLEPNAMILATANKKGRPSSRTVLLKYVNNSGLKFFTNRHSQKSQELIANPFASVTFLWNDLERQVHAAGNIIEVTSEETARYFSQRPRRSQIGSWASKQDSILSSREELAKNYAYYEEEFKDKPIPPPPYWTGFQLVPQKFEFWQGRENRLHDRFVYLLENNVWNIRRLSP